MPEKKQTSGSPIGEPVHLVVGFLRRPHGVSGELVMDIHTDFPERIAAGRKVFIGEKKQPHTLDTVRPRNDGLLVSFRGVNTPEDAGKFRNQWVYVKASELPPLPQGKYYKFQLVGLDVTDEDGNALGKITDVLETGANDVYIVTNESGKEILLPAIPPVILNLDMEKRALKVRLLEGL